MAILRNQNTAMLKALIVCLLAVLLASLCMCGSGASSTASTLAQTSGSGTSGSPDTPGGAPSGSSGDSGSSGGSSGASSAGSGGGASATPSGFPSSDHVFVVMLENQDFSQVFPSGGATSCSSAGMPYLCTLAQSRGGIATHFYSNAHGSLLAYLFNTSGADWRQKPYDCTGSGCASSGVIKGENIVSALTSMSKSWRGYFESMPSCGFLGKTSGNYNADHNPFKWYANVADTPSERDNMCPFTQLSIDINGNALPNFGYIVPNEADDAEGTGGQSARTLLLKADNWLENNLAQLLSTEPFQPGGDGILIVTFDEGRVKGKSGDSSSDDACSPTQSSGCGGHVAFVMIGPNVPSGSVATATYHFQDMLHTIIHLLGLTEYPNEANGAADIDLFGN